MGRSGRFADSQRQMASGSTHRNREAPAGRGLRVDHEILHDLAEVTKRPVKRVMRTVHVIVGKALMRLYLFRVEAEPYVSPQALELFDGIIAGTAAKLKVIGDLERVEETRMPWAWASTPCRAPMVPAIV
jgi:hypothetical protein